MECQEMTHDDEILELAKALAVAESGRRSSASELFDVDDLIYHSTTAQIRRAYFMGLAWGAHSRIKEIFGGVN